MNRPNTTEGENREMRLERKKREEEGQREEKTDDKRTSGNNRKTMFTDRLEINESYKSIRAGLASRAIRSTSGPQR